LPRGWSRSGGGRSAARRHEEQTEDEALAEDATLLLSKSLGTTAIAAECLDLKPNTPHFCFCLIKKSEPEFLLSAVDCSPTNQELTFRTPFRSNAEKCVVFIFSDQHPEYFTGPGKTIKPR
jgi:hypothetical protein